MPNYSLLVDIE